MQTSLPRLSTAVLAALILIALDLGYVWLSSASSLSLLTSAFSACLLGLLLFRGTAQNLFLSAAAMSAAFCGLEFYASLTEPHGEELEKPRMTGPRLVLGWGPLLPGRYEAIRRNDGKLIYDVVYTIDDNLLRKTEAGASGEGVAFLGDSYVFGQAIADRETLPQQFADLEGRHYPVYNLAFPAYNVAQALAEMQTGLFDRLLANAQLFVEFIAPWQAERTSCKASFVENAPHYIESGGELVFAGYCHPTVSDLNRFAAYRVFVQPRLRVVEDRDIEILLDVAAGTIRMAREKYRKPIVIYYERNPGYLAGLNWTDDKIMERLRSAGAKVLDYTLEDDYNPKYQIVGDGHPNALANEIRAKRLLEFVEREFPEMEKPFASAPR
ncbi:MAG TPA: hypothetical protein VKV77_02225 [Methylovirgula sp.]|nr:hypothetical protein [Methylovirgula sp.]